LQGLQWAQPLLQVNGGILAASEWMGDGEPFGPAMEDYFTLRGMRYPLAAAAAYDDFLGLAGFTDVSVADSSHLYRADAHSELARMQGPLREPMIAVLGAEKQAHFVRQWQAMVTVLDLGALRTGYLRAHKPA